MQVMARPSDVNDYAQAVATRMNGFVSRTVGGLPSPRTPRKASSPPHQIGPKRFDNNALAESEERLLTAVIAQHMRLSPAMDDLLDDLELLDESRRAVARRALPIGNPASTMRMEDLLFQAVMRTNPNRELAIERLLGDVCGDAAIDEDELRARAAFERTIDNDFDGMS